MLGVVGGLALAHGGYFPRAWGATSALVLWAATLGVLFVTRVQVSGLGLVTLLALAALLIWTALSVLWSVDPAQSVLEVQRGLAYLSALTAVLLFTRPSGVGAVLGALLTACTLVSVYALVTWVASDADRVSAPIGYSGAVGLFAAMGGLLALGFAARAEARITRALAGASLVPLGATLALTGSRAALAGLALGVAVAISLEPRRRGALAAIAAVLAASALAAWVAAPEPPVSAPTLGATLLLLSAGSAVVGLGLGLVRGPPNRRLVIGAVVVLVLVSGLAVAAAGPRGEDQPLGPAAARRFEAVRADDSLQARLRLWKVAWWSARQNPLLGSGAGGYTRIWTRERPTRQGERDAHNLYLETLAELGLVGLGLLLLALAAPLVAAVRARGHRLAPAAAGAYVAYLVHAGAHWDWEMPALTVTALASAAAMLVAATRAPRVWALGARARAVVAAALVGMSALAVAGVAGHAAVARSRAAVGAGAPDEAVAQARLATRWQPWSGEPWQLLGEAALAKRDIALARASFRRGLELDPASWRLWAGLSLISSEPVKRIAAQRAERLNPLWRTVDGKVASQ